MDRNAAMRAARSIDEMADAFHPRQMSGQSCHPGTILDAIEAALLWGAGRVGRDDFMSAIEDLHLDETPTEPDPRRGGNPTVVFHDADTVDSFVEEVLAGYVAEITDTNDDTHLVAVTGSGRDDDGGVAVLGHAYDEATAASDPTRVASIPWESITTIDVP